LKKMSFNRFSDGPLMLDLKDVNIVSLALLYKHARYHYANVRDRSKP
jgi:hypothetical protein